MPTDDYKALRNLIKRNGKKKPQPEQNGEVKYELTPKGIFYMALYETYGDCIPEKEMRNIKRFDAFAKAVLENLSKKSTSGGQSDLFGIDFNQFFGICVNAINLCGKMQKILEDHGIEVDFSDLSDGEQED